MKPSIDWTPNKWDGVVAVLVVLMAVLWGLVLWKPASSQLTVVVTADGQELERCALQDFPEQIRYTSGGYQIQAERDAQGIRVTAADCPTQDCVHTGVICQAGESIVCLPARIIIRLEGSQAAQDGPDLVIG